MKDFVTKANKTGSDDSGTSTKQGAFEQNSLNDENKNVVTTAGLTTTSGLASDPNTTQLAEAINIYSQAGNAYQDSGVVNAYVLSGIGSLQQPTSYIDGEIIAFTTSNTNTSSTTVNKNTLGIKKILLSDGSTDLSGGEIISGRNIFLKYDSNADSSVGAYILISNIDLWAQNNFLHIQDQKSSGTLGGGLTAGVWTTRDLNTDPTNTITGASLLSNQVTLPSGTYRIEAYGIGYLIGRNKIKLYNITDASDVCIGSSEFSNTTNGDTIKSLIDCQFQIISSKVFEIQHRSDVTNATTGLGIATNIAGTVEVYCDFKIWRIGE